MRLTLLETEVLCHTKCLHVYKRFSPCKENYDQCLGIYAKEIFSDKEKYIGYLCSCLLYIFYFLFFCTLKALNKSKSCILKKGVILHNTTLTLR